MLYVFLCQVLFHLCIFHSFYSSSVQECLSGDKGGGGVFVYALPLACEHRRWMFGVTCHFPTPPENSVWVSIGIQLCVVRRRQGTGIQST